MADNDRAPTGSFRAKVYRAEMDVDTENPWCASMPYWPNEEWLRSGDGFYRTYTPTREAAMWFVDWKLLNDPVRLREWANHYGYDPVLTALERSHG